MDAQKKSRISLLLSLLLLVSRLRTVFMENHWKKHPSITHSHSACLHSSQQWCYPFIPPSNQRSLHSHQFPWQLCSDWYSCIPGYITVAAETIKTTKRHVGCSYEMLQPLSCRKKTTGAIYPWQHEVILRLNVDPCQSGCILISHENCWYKWNRHVCLCMQKQ